MGLDRSRHELFTVDSDLCCQQLTKWQQAVKQVNQNYLTHR